MRISYDPEVDAAYIHLTEESLPPGRDSISCRTPDGSGCSTVVMDWKDGKIAGLEVLDASSLLHADLLAQAVRPGSHDPQGSPPQTWGASHVKRGQSVARQWSEADT